MYNVSNMFTHNTVNLASEMLEKTFGYIEKVNIDTVVFSGGTYLFNLTN